MTECDDADEVWMAPIANSCLHPDVLPTGDALLIERPALAHPVAVPPACHWQSAAPRSAGQFCAYRGGATSVSTAVRERRAAPAASRAIPAAPVRAMNRSNMPLSPLAP